ncbi:epoxide hydrolase a, partial [Quercus suber]
TARIIKRFLTSRSPHPPCIPKEGFRTSPNTTLPAWLCEEDVNYSVSKFDNRGFTGGLNYYRALDLYVSFTSLLKSYLHKIMVVMVLKKKSGYLEVIVYSLWKTD